MFYTYIMASRRNGTLYTGQTDNLIRRSWEHRSGAVPGFSKDYGCSILVWWKAFETRAGAVTWERRIKEWRRDWKLRLIEEMNPDWRDLHEQLVPEFDIYLSQ